ncbi:YibE/F family protein [Actinoplanes sp. NPDC049599]|uniref:YibE/F family protein n=1 Tax=Actinoplanes sp. NPDC049599 TaxID=3363903 RepID=UPI00378AA467
MSPAHPHHHPPSAPHPARRGLLDQEDCGQGYSIVDFQRSTPLWLLGAVFALAVIAFARANPGYGFRHLYAAATRVGRAHIASVINTIVLAYAGASLPLMLPFTAGTTPTGELLTGELIAQELVRSAVGTIGLITAVPITTALAAVAAVHHRRPADEQHDHDAEAAIEPAQPPTRPPAEDPWAAFVERRPGWRNE